MLCLILMGLGVVDGGRDGDGRYGQVVTGAAIDWRSALLLLPPACGSFSPSLACQPYGLPSLSRTATLHLCFTVLVVFVAVQ